MGRRRALQAPAVASTEVDVFKRRATKPASMFQPQMERVDTSFLAKQYLDFSCPRCGAAKVFEVSGSSGLAQTSHKAETWGRKDDLVVSTLGCEACGHTFTSSS